MSIYNYTTGDFIRTATEAEGAKYLALLETLCQSQRDAGAVDGAEFGFPGLTIYMI
jgi:hypothetical protein